MAERIPPELQKQIIRLQQIQDQLNKLLVEKSVVENELREVNRVLEVVTSLQPDAILYRGVSNLLIRTQKSDIEKELNERKELLELKVKSYQKQEAILRKQLEDAQKLVNESIAKYYPEARKQQGA